MYNEFETIRHGDKNADGSLSEKGVEQSKEKAVELYEEIKSAEGGSVFFILPSKVGRAKQTGREIELKLKELFSGQSDVEFISVQDVARRMQETKDNFDRKFIITELQPTSSIGFDAETDYLPAWKEYGKKLGGNEYNVLRLWATKSEEMGSVGAEMQEKFNTLDITQLQPKDFVRTPEEEALNYLRLSKRMAEIVEKYFPGHSFKNIQVGHNPADFSVLALMGKEISAQNLRELWNGKSRDFVESAKFEVKKGRIVVKYRDHETTEETSLEEVIKKLERQSAERKLAWEKK